MAKSYKDLGAVPLMFEDEEILDRVIELYGQFKNRWAIRDILTKELELEKPISIITIGILIGRAKLKIRANLKIEPNEYKGRIIQCLEIIIGGKAKYRDKLKALEMLATYTGVEQQVQEDPSDYAKRVAEAIKQMDASVGGTLIEGTTDVSQEQNKQAEGTGQEEREGASQAREAGSQTDKV